VRRPVRTLPPLIAAASLLLATPAGADIYSWTDKDGVVHFSNTKGAGSTAGAKAVVKTKDAPATGGPRVAPSDKDPARYTRYDTYIKDAATLYQIPVELVRAVIKVESDYDPKAVSVSGARGLMQLMPATADQMQVKDMHDPRDNIFGGVRLLRILANTFNGDLELTVAAYNAGEDAVVRHGGIPPYQQTKDYVVKVLKYYRRYRAGGDIVTASTAAD